MTRATNARLAGVAFLSYIAAGIGSLMLFARATGGEGAAAKLASVARHATELRLGVVLTLVCAFAALVLAVTLYGLTRDEDHELAMLALTCRVTEGVLAGVAVDRSLGLLWLATARGVSAPDAPMANALGAFLLGQRWGATVTATFFAVGSTIFCWLLLRGRTIPVPLARLGVAASLLLVVALPLQLGGVRLGTLATLVWLPMLVFEVGLALWFIVRGVAVPSVRPAPLAHSYS